MHIPCALHVLCASLALRFQIHLPSAIFTFLFVRCTIVLPLTLSPFSCPPTRALALSTRTRHVPSSFSYLPPCCHYFVYRCKSCCRAPSFPILLAFSIYLSRPIFRRSSTLITHSLTPFVFYIVLASPFSANFSSLRWRSQCHVLPRCSPEFFAHKYIRYLKNYARA